MKEKTTTTYIAKDDREFDTAAACQEYEKFLPIRQAVVNLTDGGQYVESPKIIDAEMAFITDFIKENFVDPNQTFYSVDTVDGVIFAYPFNDIFTAEGLSAAIAEHSGYKFSEDQIEFAVEHGYFNSFIGCTEYQLVDLFGAECTINRRTLNT